MHIYLLALFAFLFVSAGCSTTSMKGTPFYTGEYEQREGPAADRVNLWPLFYYRDPALSVIWPFMELCPDHLAVRPLYSVYNRSSDHAVHNVVWPISRFDPANERYRIFPVYWGNEYFNVFPLYWHEGDPFSGIGHNAFFPFWIWNNKADGHSLDILWPIYASQQFPNHQHWRIWPLYGTSKKEDSLYRYYAWPLIHTYTDASYTGHAVLPVYGYRKGR
ncbi:MAG TPA: hypothetical protein VIR63_00605, partial [Pontiella sp.]